MIEKEKMLAGLWYDANNDQALISERIHAQDLCYEYNHTKPSDLKTKNNILEKLFNQKLDNVTILSNFICDYGFNMKLGKNIFINSDCYMMDCAKIVIHDNCFIGPKCGFYTAIHPLDADTRNQGLEKALPITLEGDNWIGGHVVILPGVTIGKGAVVGAGSVVTKDVEKDCVVAGNPAKVIKRRINSES